MHDMEKIDQNMPRAEVAIVADERGNEYAITGGDMFDIAYRLYVSLGGKELSKEECIQMLKRGGELRPRSGIFAISMRGGIKKQLIVENRNMSNDTQMNGELREAVDRCTQAEVS